jgi:WhiB family redox-sensing transcriptional regulator
MTTVLTNTDWITDAACRGESELFFAPAGERPGRRITRETMALAICATCPVRHACADAGADEEYGIWGGIIKGGAQ